MKKTINHTIFKLVLFFARILWPISSKFARYVLVTPPTDIGSVGDQALIQGLQNGLKSNKLLKIKQFLLTGFSPQKLRHEEEKPINTKLHSTLHKILFIKHLLFAKSFIVLGADSIDGSYSSNKSLGFLEFCEISDHMGVPTCISSFSFSETPHPAVVEKLIQLSSSIRFLVRDPISLQRFENATGLEASLVADLGFLVQPEANIEKDQIVFNWINQRRSLARTIIGVNINVLPSKGDLEDSYSAYADALSRILLKYENIDFLFVPHDYREGQSDEDTAEGICKHLENEFSERLFVLNDIHQVWEIKDLVGRLDLVITGRMHLAIASLGMGVVPVVIAYLGKFEGLLSHFGLKGLLLEPDFEVRSDDLLDQLTFALENLNALKDQISSQIDSVEKLSRKNIASVV